MGLVAIILCSNDANIVMAILHMKLPIVSHLQGGSKTFELKTFEICQKMSKTFEIFEIHDFDLGAKTFEIFCLKFVIQKPSRFSQTEFYTIYIIVMARLHMKLTIMLHLSAVQTML